VANLIQDASGVWRDVTALTSAVFRDDRGLSYVGTPTGATIADETGISYTTTFTGAKFSDDTGLMYTVPTFTGSKFQDGLGYWFTIASPSAVQVMWLKHRRRK
jgi:hypothetical protein